MTPEGKVKKDIKDYLTSLGSNCRYFMTQNMGMGESGVSDIIGAYFGTPFAIEVKKDDKTKVTPWQARFMMEWSGAGGRVLIAWNVEKVQVFMEDIKRRFWESK